MPEGVGYEQIEAEMSVQDDAAQREAEAQKKKQQQEALITKWVDKIKRARTHDKKAREQWADDRRVARGESEWLVDTNLIGAFLEILAAFLYAKNPDISVKPTPSVNRQLLKEYRAVGETLEIINSRMLKDGGLKRIAKRWVRGAMTVGISWIKVAMQTRNERDPLTERKINDLQDNLTRMKALQSKLEDGEKDNSDETKAEIESQLIALQGQLERQVAQGLVLDIMAPEDVVVAPDCGEIENYRNAPWIAFDLYKSKEEAMEITKWKASKLESANLYTQRPRKGETDEEGRTNATQWVSMDNEDGESAENPDGFYRFTEIWSLTDGVVYTYLDGVRERWAREPYAPRTGLRYFPCFALAFHPVDGERWPQSDVYQLKKLQNEYASIRSNYAEHRRRAVPGIIFNATQVKDEDVNKLTSAQTQEYVGINPTSPTADIRMLFQPKAYNSIDSALYNTQVITTEMEKVSGVQDAMQSAVQVEKTATEAQIMEAGRGARIGARLDTLEDALTDLAEYTTQLILLTLDETDAMRYAGPDAVWVDMTTDQALSLYNIEIKAGSTGKPKANSDREAWGTLMPLIEGMIDRIGQARMKGQEWAAKPWIALLEESFNRLDDHGDIEKFLPAPTPEVIEATMNPPPAPIDEAEKANKEADTIYKLAQALEKEPLFAKKAIQAQGMKAAQNGQGSAGPQPPQEELPPAPNPLTNEIN